MIENIFNIFNFAAFWGWNLSCRNMDATDEAQLCDIVREWSVPGDDLCPHRYRCTYPSGRIPRLLWSLA